MAAHQLRIGDPLAAEKEATKEQRELFERWIQLVESVIPIVSHFLDQREQVHMHGGFEYLESLDPDDLATVKAAAQSIGGKISFSELIKLRKWLNSRPLSLGRDEPAGGKFVLFNVDEKAHEELTCYIIAPVLSPAVKYFTAKYKQEYPDGNPCEWHHPIYQYLTDMVRYWSWPKLIDEDPELAVEFDDLLTQALTKIGTFEEFGGLGGLGYQGIRGPVGAQGPRPNYHNPCDQCRGV